MLNLEYCVIYFKCLDLLNDDATSTTGKAGILDSHLPTDGGSIGKCRVDCADFDIVD